MKHCMQNNLVNLSLNSTTLNRSTEHTTDSLSRSDPSTAVAVKGMSRPDTPCGLWGPCLLHPTLSPSGRVAPPHPRLWQILHHLSSADLRTWMDNRCSISSRAGRNVQVGENHLPQRKACWTKVEFRCPRVQIRWHFPMLPFPGWYF